jgi:hypothetical protein
MAWGALCDALQRTRGVLLACTGRQSISGRMAKSSRQSPNAASSLRYPLCVRESMRGATKMDPTYLTAG